MTLLSRKKLALLLIIGAPGALVVDKVFLAENDPNAPSPASSIVDAAMNAVVSQALSSQSTQPGVADALSSLLDAPSTGQPPSINNISDIFAAVANPTGINTPSAAAPDQPTASGIRVSAVSTAAGGAAIINGTLVRVGDETEAGTLVRLEERAAVIADASGQETVHFIR